MWVELAEQRRRHVRQVVAAVEAGATKRLRAKDEEIARLGRLNWALEERVRSLSVEAQVWRDMAHSNEAAAGALRGELQQALDAQARRRGGQEAASDKAASCCCGENDGAGEDEEVATATRGGRRCPVCGEAAGEVLLLPCRHLCACASCAAVARACPACGCAKNGSVCVNK
jgi:E3 ubiquitin-protein ligase BOI and related proteins